MNLAEEVAGIRAELDEDLVLPDQVLPDPGIVDAYHFRKERKLFLYGDVEESAAEIADAILLYNLEDNGKKYDKRHPITLYIMSDGGGLEAMWMLVDLIELSGTPVWTVNIGEAASAAALVFLAGKRRLMLPNAEIIIHEGAAQMAGDANKILDAAENYDRSIQRMRAFILKRTKIPKNVFNRHRKDDWYLNAKQSLDYGLCDKIISSLDEII